MCNIDAHVQYRYVYVQYKKPVQHLILMILNEEQC